MLKKWTLKTSLILWCLFTSCGFADTGDKAFPPLDDLWTKDQSNVPFSFIYDGHESSEFLSQWGREERILPGSNSEARREEITYTDQKTGLSVRAEVTVYQDFPAVEWVLYFKNNGESDTPIIENIQALDQSLPFDPQAKCVLHYAKGSMACMDDFAPQERKIGRSSSFRLEPGGGRSSNEFLPFFNLEIEEEAKEEKEDAKNNSGLIYAIGWTGEWAAEFSRDDKGTLRTSAGMDLTHLKLHPGESIRTPRLLLLSWKGDRIESQNTFRRLILAHYRPQQNGKPLELPTMLFDAWGAEPIADHIKKIKMLEDAGISCEYHWIDAQWHGSGEDWFKNVGNWDHCENLYPEGFKPLSDLLHGQGRKFLLWFEPERVACGTQWYTEHQDFLLKLSPDQEVRCLLEISDYRCPDGEFKISRSNQFNRGDLLFNLGDPKAREFLTNYISEKITEYGIDCYRQDFNFAPLDFWRNNDAPDRQGITEIRYIEGLYAYWDSLLERHPHLIIDNCASGGRRIDLETIRRATPFWRSDSGFFSPLETQCHSYGLNLWVPLQGAGQPNRVMCEDKYSWRSFMTPAVDFAADLSGDLTKLKENFKQYQSIHKYFYGDFYPLTEYTQNEDAWMAYQLNRPDLHEGVVVALKRPKSYCTKAIFKLSGLEENAIYEFTDIDNDKTVLIPGKKALEPGLEIELPNNPDSAIFTYRKQSQ